VRVGQEGNIVVGVIDLNLANWRSRWAKHYPTATWWLVKMADSARVCMFACARSLVRRHANTSGWAPVSGGGQGQRCVLETYTNTCHGRIRGLVLNADMLARGPGSPRALIPGAPAAPPRARRSARGLDALTGYRGHVTTS